MSAFWRVQTKARLALYSVPSPPKILTTMSDAGAAGGAVEALGPGAQRSPSSAAETGRAFT